MAVVGFFGRFFGRTVSEAAAYGAGLATGPALRPVTRAVESEIWKLHQDVPVNPETAAAIVAEDVEQRDWGANEAASNGIDGSRFDALVGEALTAPGVGELFALWRRGLIDSAAFEHGLRKAKMESRWDTPLEGLHDVLLSSEELAMLQQQGFIGADRANSEGALQGVTSERQQLRFDASGLPPGIATALDLLRRGIIDRATFAQIVREGHTKTKYTDDLLALERRLLTDTEYVDAHLRGYLSEAEMLAGTRMHGLTDADAQTLFKSHGRPITVHQVTTGLARGGSYDGPIDAIPTEYITSLREGSIKPPWYNLAYANRYTLPSFFVLRFA